MQHAIHHFRIDGLLQVGPGAQLQALLDVALRTQRTQDHHARSGILRQDPAQGLLAVALGHHQVHQHHVRLQRLVLADRLMAVAGLAHHVEAAIVELAGRQHAQGARVIAKQNRRT